MHLETGYPNYTNQLLANIVSGGSHSYHFGGYARNDGWNRDLFRDVMAQLYVPALETEMDLREYVRTQNYKVVTYNVSANHTWGYKQDYYDTFINRPNTVLITNIWNNPGLSNEVIKLFRGDGTYEEVDYKDSLKVKDNHQYYIFWRENIRQMVVLATLFVTSLFSNLEQPFMFSIRLISMMKQYVRDL